MKVLVYMATYNGAKYLREQLDSILAQENVEIDLLIADDASSDETIDILREYAERDGRICYYRNEKNLGYKRNFISLIRHSLENDYDYFALSDQDDVWKKDKIYEAVKYIQSKNLPEDSPVAYSSNLTVVDEKLQEKGSMNSFREIKKYNVYNLLLENKCTGCTLVFNTALRNILLHFPPEKVVYPHDELICKLAILFGQYLFDDRSFILYRQHGLNQIGVNRGGKFKKYSKMLFDKKRILHTQCFIDILEYYPQAKERKLFCFFYNVANYKTKFKCRLALLFSPKYRAASCGKTLVFKMAVLIGKY